jgi:hypothetical protein
MKNKILISAANGPIMRSLILQLKKLNFYIIGIDSNALGAASKFCDELRMVLTFKYELISK